MTVVAIDPGISTGVAIHTHDSVHEDTLEIVAPGEYLMLVVTDVPKLWSILEHHMPLEAIVVENFAAGGLISKDGQATIRLVGAMELAAHLLGARFVLQFPAERKAFMPAARQMLVQRGRTPISHEVDSLSHLLLYEHRRDTGILDKITANRRQTWR